MAPSPTGFLHLGNARTFLFDFLYARHQGATLVLRVEDTDAERSTPEAEAYLVDALHWLGITWDEGPDIGGPHGPYRQSERSGYAAAAEVLLEKGRAYRCFCTDEELEAERRGQQERGEAPRYSRRCLHLSKEQVASFVAEGRRPSVRFLVPAGLRIMWIDAVYGETVFESDDLGDFVILRRDGLPIYNFANVVDDHAMEITVIIRSQSHLSNTPRQIMLYDALAWQAPTFAHVPDVLDAGKGKLSKRRGARGVTEYRDEGYLPQAVVNYLALLGWSPPSEEEFLSLDQLRRLFSFDRVQKSNAALDETRLEWFNAEYIRRISIEELIRASLPFLQEAGLVGSDPSTEDLEMLRRILPLIQTRVRTLKEIPGMIDFFFRDRIEAEPADLVPRQRSREEAAQALQALSAELSQTEPWTSESIAAAVDRVATLLGWKRGETFMLLRVVETGRTVTPPLTESMEVLGKDAAVQRVNDQLGGMKAALPA